MKKWLSKHLICPECIESQVPLMLEIERRIDDDVLQGKLYCEACHAIYKINEGIAVVVPEKTLPLVNDEAGYNTTAMLSAYLWSHYSEFFNGSDATDAYKKWASHLLEKKNWALDIGCSVGRLSFELSQSHGNVIGLDTSYAFIKKAREILSKRTLRFDMIIEGQITEEKVCDLDSKFQFGNIEFIVADAMALPFTSHMFDTAASVNILEKVPHPGQHLKEIDRILQKKDSSFLFSDPFSWDENISDPKSWLSGLNNGEFKGRGIDNISRIMSKGEDFFEPRFTIQEKGDVLWKIRKTRNLWEYITSQFVIGKRG